MCAINRSSSREGKADRPPFIKPPRNFADDHMRLSLFLRPWSLLLCLYPRSLKCLEMRSLFPLCLYRRSLKCLELRSLSFCVYTCGLLNAWNCALSFYDHSCLLFFVYTCALFLIIYTHRLYFIIFAFHEAHLIILIAFHARYLFSGVPFPSRYFLVTFAPFGNVHLFINLLSFFFFYSSV